MLKSFRAYLPVLTVVISVCFILAFGSAGYSAENIKIGIMVPTSGSEAYYGNDMYQAYQLAAEDINKAGGVLGRQLELYLADDGCNPNMSTQAASKILAQNPDFVVGGYCSGSTITALQQFYDADLVMLVSVANSTEITKLGLEQTFMVNSPGSYAIDTLIELMNYLNVKKIALIHQGDAYTKNLSDICDEVLPPAGFEIVTTQVMEKGAADVSAIVTAVRNSQAEFLYWCGYYADGSNVIKQLRQGGYTGIICVGDGSMSPELITACGPAGEGVYVTSPPFVEFVEGGEAFMEAYRNKFGMPAGTYANISYDTLMMLKIAIEEAGTIETSAVRDKIQNISYKGLSGEIKFKENREPALSNFIILQIENGAFKLVNVK